MKEPKTIIAVGVSFETREKVYNLSVIHGRSMSYIIDFAIKHLINDYKLGKVQIPIGAACVLNKRSYEDMLNKMQPLEEELKEKGIIKEESNEPEVLSEEDAIKGMI